ncbi:MAG: hypothetical protein EHM86_03765 [Desulfobulbaceae bacterium]|nr:MAG: hypothetical protein EHM86_03765 [Desulfobulbaceae bacterium]
MKKIISVVFAWAVLVTPCAVFAQQQTTVNTQTTETTGTISEMSPDGIVIRSETSSSPTNYTYTKSTTYVDEAGAPVAMETVKSGQPVTVYYTTDGGRTTATRVIVRKTTTTTDGPSIEKKTTTTTTTENK